MSTDANALKKSLALVAMSACFSMLFLNESGAIAVTFPKMQQMLGLSNNAIDWVMNSFLLTAAVLLLLGGKLADHYGRRRIFTIGMVIFLLASALCGFAENTWMMLVGRVFQAIGASLVYPSGTALISNRFPGNEFAKAYGTILGVSYFFVAFGPFVGGVFTEFLNWRWIFWINVPFGILCFFLTLYAIPNDKPDTKPHVLDVKGLLVFMIGLGALVVALMQGSLWGWSSGWIIGLFVLAFVGLLMFGIIELKSAEPLLDIRLFKNKEFFAGNVIFPATAACFTALVFWAIWLQQTFIFSPFVAGIAMIPATALSLFMLRISGAWGGRVGPRKPMMLGSVLLVIGMFWISVTSLMQNYWFIFIGFICFGFATPLIIPNSIGVIMNSVDQKQHGVASGVYLTLQHVAFSLGFAILAAVISTYDERHLDQFLTSNPDFAPISSHQVHLLLAGKNIIPNLTPDKLVSLKQSAIAIYTQAFSFGMAAIGMFAIIAFLFTFIFIKKRP